MKVVPHLPVRPLRTSTSCKTNTDIHGTVNLLVFRLNGAKNAAHERGVPVLMNQRLHSVNAEDRATGAATYTMPDTPKLRVVIVEDSAIIRARLSESLLEIPNVEIVGQVESESDALAVLRQQQWDVAVLDLQLKQGTGLGVLKALNRSLRPPNARIIVFTNFAFPQYRERSMALGADYFFDKSREFHRVREVLAGMAAAPESIPH